MAIGIKSDRVKRAQRAQMSYGSGALPSIKVGQLTTSFNDFTQNFRITLDNGSNNYTVDWGDGNSDTVLSGNTISHEFTTSDEKLLNFQPETSGDKVLIFLYTGNGILFGDLDFTGYDSITEIRFTNAAADSILLPVIDTTALTRLVLSNNNISILDIKDSISLFQIVINQNSIQILDTANLTLLRDFRYGNNNVSAAQTDQIFIARDFHGILNGNFEFQGYPPVLE